MTGARFAAVDLGASSGRVVVGQVGRDSLSLDEVHRFANVPVNVGGTLTWDILGLYAEMLDGLRAAVRQSGSLLSVGIDGWAVDYGLLDETDTLLGNPVHYRDARTEGVMARVLERVPAARLYATTGIQFLSLNTLNQLASQTGSPQLAAARALLLLPDLLSFWLTGVKGTEVTNASTTQLLDVTSRTWSQALFTDVGIPNIFAPLRSPRDFGGMIAGPAQTHIDVRQPLPVTVVCSHDTASAVVAVPATDDDFAYISCGTWSLVGVELDEPVLTEESRRAGFTNEAGIDGTIRYLRNVMGLWLLQECMRTWNMNRSGAAVEALLREAEDVPAFTSLVNPDDQRFLTPGDMPTRIQQACADRNEPVPTTRAQVVRCVVDSLAVAYRSALNDVQELSGRAVNVVHIVGGGAQNALLCQLTADACNLPVVAGPVEAAALGNVLVQAQTVGAVGESLAAVRGLVRSTQRLRRYAPRGDQSAWASAAVRVGGGP